MATHLISISINCNNCKLDRVASANNGTAERLSGFKVDSVEERRDASLVGLFFKLLDGAGRGERDSYKPVINCTTIKLLPHTKAGTLLQAQLHVSAAPGLANKTLEEH